MSEIEQGSDDHVLALLKRIAIATEEFGAPGGLEPPRQRLSQLITSAGAIAGTGWQLAPGGVNSIWLIERISLVTNTAQATPVGSVYVTESLPAGGLPSLGTVALDDLNLAETTTLKRQVFNEADAPIFVKGGEWLLVQWTGLAANDQCRARIQARQAWQAPTY